jgi:hypothetical protein
VYEGALRDLTMQCKEKGPILDAIEVEAAVAVRKTQLPQKGTFILCKESQIHVFNSLAVF